MSDQPSELAGKLIHYLDCPCEVFAPMEDDDPLWDAFLAARAEGKKQGYQAVLVTVDEILWECLCDGEQESASVALLRAQRAELLAAPLPDAKAWMRENLSDLADGWNEETCGEVANGEALDRFSGYWNYQTELTDEVILAKIPVKQPWEIFAYLPMGGWNECPDAPEMMAISKMWYERYGAVPGACSHDELEFLLDEPVSDVETAKALAIEQYAFCIDRVEQCGEDGSVGGLADTLTKSTCWYFWWD